MKCLKTNTELDYEKGKKSSVVEVLRALVLRHVFIFILLIIYRFSTALKIHVGIKTVPTLVINLLTSIDFP